MKKMNCLFALVLLLGGCALAQDKATKNDSGNVRVSGDTTISTVDRKGF